MPTTLQIAAGTTFFGALLSFAIWGQFRYYIHIPDI